MPRKINAHAPDGSKFHFDWDADEDPTPDELANIYTQGKQSSLTPPPSTDWLGKAGDLLRPISQAIGYLPGLAEEAINKPVRAGARAMGIPVPSTGPGSTAGEMLATGMGVQPGGVGKGDSFADAISQGIDPGGQALLNLTRGTQAGDVLQGAAKNIYGQALNPLTYGGVGGGPILHKAWAP